MNVTCIDPLTDPLWTRLVDRHQSSAFHSPKWTRVLTETYGLEIRANVLLDATGEAQAGLPFCRIEDMKGKRIAILPFSDYCDPLVSDIDQWNRLTEELVKERCPISIRCLHNEVPLADKRFECYNQAKWHGLDLGPDLDALWEGLRGSARRAIRKAQQNGVVVRIARRKEELRAFFDMHLAVRKCKYRLLAQPYRFFEHIWRQIVETRSGLLVVAVHQDQVIAGVLFLEWKAGLYYKFNASSFAHLSLRPNDLVIWEGIKYGKAQGYSHLDFGLSDWDQEGLIRYKRKFATEEKTIFFLRYDPHGTPSGRESQIQRLLPQLTRLFTDQSVPDTITEKAGEILYRYFV